MVCLRFGISRSTFYRWYHRYLGHGEEDLSDLSRRPHSFGNQRISLGEEQLILELRERKWGLQRISSHLLRDHGLVIPKSSLWRVLLRSYPRRSAECAVEFLGAVLDDFGFPIRVVQTDWGTEFFNYRFQYELHEHFIKFRPIKPRSPHLNGKVERSHQTDRLEFYSTIDLNDPDLMLRLAEWQEFYYSFRPHGSLNGMTPHEKLAELQDLVPVLPDHEGFWDSDKRILPRDATFVYHVLPRVRSAEV